MRFNPRWPGWTLILAGIIAEALLLAAALLFSHDSQTGESE